MLRGVLLIAGISIGAAALAPDLLNRYFERAPAPPAAMSVSAPAPQQNYGGTVRLAADRSGHYQAEMLVNGRPLNALVDTGASFVVLRYEDARSLGVIYGSDRFDVPVQTANGVGHVRQVRLNSVRLGSIAFDDVDALVAEEGVLGMNLLGMSFLSRLSRYEVRDGSLVLER